eukprot:30937-Pelagococcus_subviridis.AAC.12
MSLQSSAACAGTRGHVIVQMSSKHEAAPSAVSSSLACSHESNGGNKRLRCGAVDSFAADINAGASITHAAATKGSSEDTAIVARTCAAAAAPNTSVPDPPSVFAAASSSAAPCHRISVLVTAATRATSAAHPSRLTAGLLWSMARRMHGTTRDTTPPTPPSLPLPTRPTQGYPAVDNNQCKRTAAITDVSTEAGCNVADMSTGSSGVGGPGARLSRALDSPAQRCSGSWARQCAMEGAASLRHFARISRVKSLYSEPLDVVAPEARDAKVRCSNTRAASAASGELHPGRPPAP